VLRGLPSLGEEKKFSKFCPVKQESILRFYSYDGATNYLKCKTGGLQGKRPLFIVFCLVTLHLWVRIFMMFPELRRLAHADDGNIIGRLSQALKLTAVIKPVFKLDGNLDFNVVKLRGRTLEESC
jgi:hypothetical protein